MHTDGLKLGRVFLFALLLNAILAGWLSAEAEMLQRDVGVVTNVAVAEAQLASRYEPESEALHSRVLDSQDELAPAINPPKKAPAVPPVPLGSEFSPSKPKEPGVTNAIPEQLYLFMIGVGLLGLGLWYNRSKRV